MYKAHVLRGYEPDISPADADMWNLVSIAKYLGVAPWELADHPEYLQWGSMAARLEEKVQDHENRKAAR